MMPRRRYVGRISSRHLGSPRQNKSAAAAASIPFNAKVVRTPDGFRQRAGGETAERRHAEESQREESRHASPQRVGDDRLQDRVHGRSREDDGPAHDEHQHETERKVRHGGKRGECEAAAKRGGGDHAAEAANRRAAGEIERAREGAGARSR